MEELGQVIELNGDLASVEVMEGDSNCGSCNSCLSSISMSSSVKETKIVKLANLINAKVGDFVVLELRESTAIFISILIYVFPILMMIGGYFLGDYLWAGIEKVGSREDNVFAIALSFIFLLIGFVIVYYVDKLLSKKKSFKPYLKSVHRTS